MTYSSTGYPTIWRPGHPRANFGYVFEHILIAEKVLGYSLPEKAVLHHHDEDRTNNANNNLVVCENQAYHLLLHQRLRVLKMGGDPNIQKFCTSCRELQPLQMFKPSKSTGDGLYYRCAACRDPKLRKDNKSGRVGVHWCKRDSKWCAYIRINGHGHHLGYYTSKDEAIVARLRAEQKVHSHARP